MIRLALIVLLLPLSSAQALPPQPAAPQTQAIVLHGATLHIGDGNTVENGALLFDQGQIQWVGPASALPTTTGARMLDVSGQHVYPGFIAARTVLGLVEVDALRHTLDHTERGDLNPSVRSAVAFNTDSEMLPVTRFNGVLLAQVAPQGGLVSGTSSIMALDGWNWQDALFAADDGVHVNWPSRKRGDFDFSTFTFKRVDNEKYAAQRGAIETLLQEAAAYRAAPAGARVNLKLAALTGLFDGSQRLHLSTDEPDELITALQFFADVGVTHPVVHGDESLLGAAPYLAANDIPIIIAGLHRLPGTEHAALDEPYRAPALFSAAGVLVGLTYPGNMNLRNLPFLAGTASAYGLDRESALALITLNVARILGIAERAGSLSAGKSATLFVSRGDALDMRSNDLSMAFIEGRELNLDGMQQQLYRRYHEKYSTE